MNRPIYLGRDGRRLQAHEWARLQKDEDYCSVRAYDNGAVRVLLRWQGKVPDPNTFTEYFPVFAMRVMNYRHDGSMVDDPVGSGKTFFKESDAIKAYETFLETWTACLRDQSGEFVELENDLAPPPPPDPDAPTSDVLALKGVDLDDGDIGAW